MTDKKDNYSDIPKNYREFYLSYTDNYEDAGFAKEYVGLPAGRQVAA